MLAGRSLWVLVPIVVALNTIAQASLKLGAGRGLVNRAVLAGLVAYGFSTIIYIALLSRARLSFVYPIVIGATAIATCLTGIKVFGERVEGLHWVGIALILAGITCIAAVRGSST
jgi:multidrug transporter EmrE-like cation transporter